MTLRGNLVRFAFASTIVALALAGVSVADAKASGTQFPYTFTNSDGSKTVIPSEPKRVVVLDSELDAITALGVHPVGFQPLSGQAVANGKNGFSEDGLPEFINGGELNGIEAIPGAGGGPNYEAIAALHPDLIIGASASTKTQLEQIAPVIEVPPSARTSTANPDPGQFWWEPEVQQFAPIFNATARANALISRIHQRAAALSELTHGQSTAFLLMLGGQNLLLISANPILYDAGTNIQASLTGASNLGFQEFSGSTELLPAVTASKVLVQVNTPFGSVDEAGFKAFPLYPEMPAAKTNQVYFTNWFVNGPISNADQLTQFSKQMFGVDPLEATLSTSGKHSSGRSGVADVDVGPTQTRVCWDITTTGSIGKPNSVALENAKGVQLFTLGKGYHKTGCVDLEQATVKKLSASPAEYTVSIDHTVVKRVKKHGHRTKKVTTTMLLKGSLAVQSPAFFGNGKDTQYNQ